MAITGTKVASANTGNRNYFINECTITDVEVMDSQYTDMSLKLQLTDNNNGYTYTCFVNQNFEKDNNEVVTGLKFPEDLNTLFLASGKDMNVSDIGEVNTDVLIDSEVACINYASTGKYKRSTWGVLSSLSNKDQLEAKFKSQLEKGYPKNYKSQQESDIEEQFGGTATNVAADDLPF